MKKNLQIHLFLFFILIPVNSVFAFQVSNILGDLKPGKYEVGFTGDLIEDQSRSFF